MKNSSSLFERLPDLAGNISALYTGVDRLEPRALADICRGFL
jgi:hypothetical protein